MKMLYPTLEDIEKMQNERIERVKKLIEEEKAKENPNKEIIRRYEARIWMMQNS